MPIKSDQLCYPILSVQTLSILPKNLDVSIYSDEETMLGKDELALVVIYKMRAKLHPVPVDGGGNSAISFNWSQAVSMNCLNVCYHFFLLQ